jgi:hypothetical protein
MPDIVTDIRIDAPADHVWRVLTDLPSYPAWNPVLRRVQGELASHRTLTVVRTRPAGGEATDYPTIVLLRPGREIRWRSRLLFPFLLDTEHDFKIEPLGPNQVRFVQWQARSGVLAYLLPSSSASAIRDQFDVMNLALKAQVEQAPSAKARPAPSPEAPEAASTAARFDRGRHAAASPS